MKKIIILLCTAFILTACAPHSSEDKKLKIGVIQWAEHPALNESLEGMLEGLELTGGKDRFEIEVKNANEDVATGNLIVSQFVNDKVDIIFAIATPAAQAAMNAVDGTDIPVVFSAVSDAKQAGLVDDIKKPSGNVTGVSDLPPLEKQVNLIKEMLPESEKIGILFNTSEVNSKNQIIEVKEHAKNVGMTIVEKGVSSSSEIAISASQLSSEVDSIFIVNDNMIAAATALVVDVATKSNVPVFMAEVGQFDQGILASDSVSYKLLGIDAGKMIHDILIEKKLIEEIPVKTADETILYISEKMAETLKIKIPETIRSRAEVR